MGISDIVNNFKCLHPLVTNRQLISKVSSVVTCPFYHIVGDHDMPHISLLYKTKTSKAFIEDIDYFGKYFEFIPLDQLGKARKSSKPRMLLSFDDGFRECFDIIRPILLEKGIPAIFFINTGYVNNDDLMYRCKASYILNYFKKEIKIKASIRIEGKQVVITNYSKLKSVILGVGYGNRESLDQIIVDNEIPFTDWLSAYKPYMNALQIQNLSADGFTIGAHSHTHSPFHQLSTQEQWHEIVTSTRIINDLVGSAACPFSFPFNDVGVSLSILDKMKVESNVNYTFGVSGFKKDVANNHYHRVAMEDSDLAANQRMKSELISHRIRKFLNKEKVQR